MAINASYTTPGDTIQRQLALRAWPSRLPVKAMIEDRRDRAIGAGADVEPAVARRPYARGAILARQAQDAETGAIVLLRVRPAFQDEGGKLGGALADACRRAPDPLDHPLGMPLVRARHVLRHRGVPAAADAAQMGSNTLAFVE